MTHTEIIELYPKESFKEIKNLKKKYRHPGSNEFSFSLLSQDKEGLKKMEVLLEKFYENNKNYITFYYPGYKGTSKTHDPEIEKITNKNKKYQDAYIWKFLTSVRGALEIHKIPYQTIIYIQEVSFSQTSTGNHGKYKAWYINKNNVLENISIPCLRSYNTKSHTYNKHGGNYSFIHDLVCEFSLMRKHDHEKLKDRNKGQDYDFFRYKELD